MAIINKSTIRVAMSVVALTLYMGADKCLFNCNQAVIEPIKKGSTVKQNRTQEVVVATYGKVKPESIKKAQDLLYNYLDNEVVVDNMVVVEGKNVEKFTGETLKIPKSKLREGQRISNSDKVNVYVAEDLIDEYVPAIALTLNNYFGHSNYEMEVGKL